MENRVQVIFEALNRTKTTFNELLKDTDNFRLKASELDSFLKQGIGFGMFYGLINEGKKAIDTNEQVQNSVRGLAAVARYSGEDIGKSLDVSMKLASDGLINVQEASQSLQNLLSRGYSLEESVNILNRLKDAAAFNRQSHLSMGEAVTSATEGLKNENSILVDNAGVTKNVSVMWKEYAKEHGISVDKLTLAQKRQAEYNGIMKETEAQVGNAKLAIEGITGAKTKMREEVFKLRNALGEGESGLFIVMAKGIAWALDNLRSFLGMIEITGLSYGNWAAKIGATLDWMKGGFSGGFAGLKEEFVTFDKYFDEQVNKIVRKWDGEISVPDIGKDNGKRRQDSKGGASNDAAKAKKQAEDWATVAAGLKADLAKIGLDDLDQKLSDLNAKAEELRKKPKSDKGLIGEWLTGMSSQAIDDEIKKLDDEIAALEEKRAEGEAEWEEALKRRAAAAQSAREAEIDYQLSIITTQEKFLQMGRGEATEQRLALTQKLLASQVAFAAGIDRLADPTGWLTQQKAIQDTRDRLLELQFQMQEQTGSLADGLGYGFQKFIQDAQTLFQQGSSLAEQTARGMEGAFSTFFFDAMTGKLESLWDYIRGFLESVAKAVAEVMAQVVAQQMIGAAIGGASGLEFINAGPQTMLFHEGGLVPRFHFGGLAADEVPAILQTKERVLSREQNALFERFANKAEGTGDVNITLINQTGQPLKATALPLRQSMRGLVREISLELADTDPTYRSRFNIS
ncbi:phage tail tape measure C-terminal domain-containing protein [Geobacter benzoatilyticus]|uniref:Bacteriophage tail tape measure C-terminal domain-containing protein n=1 Tax=Geobacter benzoatilyticus TaxID=2815309 RepID=A0ABX7Q0P5_9BACT|nr:phage tail tape measure C-terminal domain-containing protein [Geobacter benzoatilyticus]QSV44899.1 hypothetical protein JZM60_12155 [Geobacter benzoatilyticus]